MAMKIKRKRGAPIGNQNAVKHGFYSAAFKKEEQFEFDIAAGMEGIAEEIALLRFETKKAISSGDIKKLVPLSKIALALEKLIRTHHKIFVSQRQGLETAMENAFRHVLVPMGPDMVRRAAAFALPHKFPLDTTSNTNQKTINDENESKST